MREPSTTALMAAAARAAHLIVDDRPVIFSDTLAGALLGERAEELVSYHRRFGAHPVLAGARAAATSRARHVEDLLAERVAGGLDQYVVLGAGLDSFAYRAPLPPGLRVFEVDHPATQDHKRALLEAAGVAVPARVSFVPLDLEAAEGAGGLVAALVRAGLDAGRPAVVAWLGVTMYLTGAAVARTLAQVAALAPGTLLVADYVLEEGLRDGPGRAYAEAVSAAAAGQGEPWLSCFAPGGLSRLLEGRGLEAVAHVSQRDAVAPALWERGDGLAPCALFALVHARVPGRAGS